MRLKLPTSGAGEKSEAGERRPDGEKRWPLTPFTFCPAPGSPGADLSAVTAAELCTPDGPGPSSQQIGSRQSSKRPNDKQQNGKESLHTGPKAPPVRAQLRAWQLARPLPVVPAAAPAATALEILAEAGTEALPVAEQQQVLGFVTREALLAASGGLEKWVTHGEAAVNSTAGATSGPSSGPACGILLRPFGAVVGPDCSTVAVARRLDEAGDPLAIVAAADGRILGWISQRDLVEPAAAALGLDMVGGMATPFGVYLTADGVSGGVGFWPLVSTGVLMGLLVVVAQFATDFVLRWLDHLGYQVSPNPLLNWMGHWLTVPAPVKGAVGSCLEAVIYLALIRISPLAGFHAAEHQTVHTMEARQSLTPAHVRVQPRAHPRCGTNLVVLLLLASGMIYYVWSLPIRSGTDLLALYAGLAFTFLARLSIGGFVQNVFTTRPARPREIASGIRAAEELITRVAAAGYQDRSLPVRLWSMGLVQVGIGMAAVLKGPFAVRLFLQWASHGGAFHHLHLP